MRHFPGYSCDADLPVFTAVAPQWAATGGVFFEVVEAPSDRGPLCGAP